METKDKTTVTVETTIQMPADQVWEFWTKPEHITQWNCATDTWQCPRAENDLTPGGRFLSRMEAKDGSMGFDFSGIYEQVIPNRQLVYRLDDGRLVRVDFSDMGNETKVTENFEVEELNSLDLQRTGWQAILDNFKKYAESKK
ncbi:SRPBCC family protein [Rufibacter roseus]|uniref:SRPBCC family protein n=1 Tax=Rufibacter roseus TaxID=1567108 RepID=A0ABW2DPN4_9BACT|nr:SRPBCC family protein [Rufibacter roseus]